MDINANIKYVLKKRGLTQAELARRLGVTVRTVQYYANGNITVETLMKMAIALDTTVETLVSEIPLPLKEESVPTRTKTTVTKLTCPHCGEEITVYAK